MAFKDIRNLSSFLESIGPSIEEIKEREIKEIRDRQIKMDIELQELRAVVESLSNKKVTNFIQNFIRKWDTVWTCQLRTCIGKCGKIHDILTENEIKAELLDILYYNDFKSSKKLYNVYNNRNYRFALCQSMKDYVEYFLNQKILLSRFTH